MTEDEAKPTLTQFTDPMCTWCWGSEPVITHLRVAYGDQLRIEYVMGGLVEDFEEFYDAANDISEPSEVAPHWEEAADHHGMPVDTAVFDSDPPQSTYPASTAFAAARLQDRETAHRYLRRLREAVAMEGRNLNRREVQREIAAEVGLDTDRLVADIEDGTAKAAFEADLQRTRAAGVRAFPTYRVGGPDGERQASGFQSFDALADLLHEVAPDLERRETPPVETFVDRYAPVATREVAEVYGFDRGKATQTLESLADSGQVRPETRGTGRVWFAGGEA
ncbi:MULTISPECIES: DsbA family oxidoreductase [Salinibaculum]|uniref:DsbA family oxidoreductase n=1 Tax=Salinibaculum TaxID=2732368 RepID=UPI0030CAC0D4